MFGSRLCLDKFPGVEDRSYTAHVVPCGSVAGVFCMSVAQNWAGSWWSPPGMMEISFVSVRAGEEGGVQTLHTRPALASARSALQGQMQKNRCFCRTKSGAEGNKSLFVAV